MPYLKERLAIGFAMAASLVSTALAQSPQDKAQETGTEMAEATSLFGESLERPAIDDAKVAGLPEDLLAPPESGDADPSLTIATRGYGVANYFLAEGDETRAVEIFRKILESPNWAAFGYIRPNGTAASAGNWQQRFWRKPAAADFTRSSPESPKELIHGRSPSITPANSYCRIADFSRGEG